MDNFLSRFQDFNTLRFQARVGTQAFECGQHTVLLDFEDKTGPCGGTTPTHAQVIGKVADGRLSVLRWTLLGAMALGSFQRAQACASCGCGDPTLTAMGVEKPFRNRVRLSIEQRIGGHIDAGDATQTLVARTLVAASWSPLSWLTVATALPIIASEVRRAGVDARRLVGIGDLELYSRAVVFRDRRFSPRHLLGLTAGLKFPTGPRVQDSSGYPAAADLQPGSGSFDPNFGVSYSYFGSSVSAFSFAELPLHNGGTKRIPAWFGRQRHGRRAADVASAHRDRGEHGHQLHLGR